MKFGPDINTDTSFDETVYTLRIPTVQENDMAQSLDVLPRLGKRSRPRAAGLRKRAFQQDDGGILN